MIISTNKILEIGIQQIWMKPQYLIFMIIASEKKYSIIFINYKTHVKIQFLVYMVIKRQYFYRLKNMIKMITKYSGNAFDEMHFYESHAYK